MKIEQIVQGNRAVLHLKGEFDTFHCPAFTDAVEALAKSGAVRVALNLRLTPFLNSTALGALVKARKRLRDAGGELAIAQPSPFVKSVIEKVGLEKSIRMFPDEAQALAHLEAAPAPGKEAPKPAAPRRDPLVETRSPIEVQDAATVLFTLQETGRRKALGKEVGIGRLAAVEDDGLAFLYGGPDGKVETVRAAEIFGSEAAMRLKFWLPLYKKQGPLEVNATARAFEAQPDGAVRVRVRFGEVGPEDHRAIEQFVRDMRFLKTELKQATGKP
ncbi:MAG TPA: STAS domain-containing protein [Planctomycetota bacterium]|jgi:anti-sigma B factor antagonist|nr:STAS domain-containing protein [Planctomycetota bacterium]